MLGMRLRSLNFEYRAEALGVRVQGLCFRVEGVSEVRVWVYDSGLGVEKLRTYGKFRVCGSCSG